jgi:phytoene synthase
MAEARLRRDDVAASRRVLRGGSRSFHAASLLLPRRVRDSAAVLYRFCRIADDMVDLHGGRHGAIEALRTRLDRAYAGCEDEHALAEVFQRHGVPRLLPEMLLEGLAWDAEQRRYADLDALLAYAARVAGTVGAMMTLLMGARSAAALARACDLGVAMQLSNIARDVGEDARAGRLYLPLSMLEQAGIDAEAWLAAPRFTPALGGVVCELLNVADRLYARAASGIALLPFDCRPGIQAARLLYAGIGHEVARRGGDSIARRAVVPTRRKAALLARALASPWPGSAEADAAPLAATRPLVDAAAQASADERAGAVEFVLDLFERLERRDRGLWAGQAEMR